MNLINNTIFILALTCITGSFMTVVWMVIYLIIRKTASAKIIYDLLKCIIAGYVVPVVFLINRVSGYVRNEPYNIIFEVTYEIQLVFVWIFSIWIAGMIVHIVADICAYIKFRKLCRARVNITKKHKVALDHAVAKVGISRRVCMYCGYSVGMPFVSGMFRPCIYVAPDCNDSREIDMILMHELYHVKQGDIIWKPVFLVISCVYWFNPLAWLVVNQMCKWAEAACDEFCCSNKFSENEYFDAIYNIADRTMSYVSKFAPMWNEGNRELKWRINCMKRDVRKKLTKRGLAAIVIFAVFGASVSSYAADFGATSLYNGLYDATVVESEEAISDVSSDTEYTGTLDDLDGTTVIELSDLGISTASDSVPMNWKVPKKTTLISSKFTESEGDEVYIAVGVSPSDKYVKVGIIQPDTTTRYVYSCGDFAHTFKITQSGTHKVYVTNGNSSKVTVIGYYRK